MTLRAHSAAHHNHNEATPATTNGMTLDRGPTTAVVGESADAIKELLGEILGLTRDIASAQRAGAISSEVAAAMELQLGLDGLPDRIALAMAEALSQQHRMIIHDMRATLDEFAARYVGAVQETTPEGRNGASRTEG